MDTASHLVHVDARQLKIKTFCIWIENKFETCVSRVPFAIHMAVLAAVFYGLAQAELNWFADSPWPVHVILSLIIALAAFWTILLMVRRFHDLGRTGGLFWAIAIPFWALWKITTLFPNLWYVWVILCAWPIKLTLELFFKPGTEGLNSYDARTTEG